MPGIFDKMTDPNTEKFEAIRDHMNRADLSTTEQFDRAILTLSTAGLGFSIAFIKHIVPLDQAVHLWLLHVSWICFVAAIVVTVLSFMTAKGAIRDTRMYAFKYYMERDDSFGARISPYSRVTYFLNFLSGLVFITAIVFTVAFASLNVPTEPCMNDEKNVIEPGVKKGYVPPPANTGGKPQPAQPKEPASQKPQPPEDKT